MRIVPLRLMTWQNSHLRLTEALTFMIYLPAIVLFFYLAAQCQKIQAEHYTPLPVRVVHGRAVLVKLSLNLLRNH